MPDMKDSGTSHSGDHSPATNEQRVEKTDVELSHGQVPTAAQPSTPSAYDVLTGSYDEQDLQDARAELKDAHAELTDLLRQLRPKLELKKRSAEV